MNITNPKIMVGLSGGVDSSVTALLLKRQGYQVSAAFMKNWEEDSPDGSGCQASVDFADAQAVCDKLDLELRAINFSTEYWEQVFSYFLSEYRAGRTPNPDILCNKEIKFKVFLNYAKQQGADLLATGHYAQVRPQGSHFELHKGSDPLKDQSYFLYALNQEQLSQSIFPVGHLSKAEVRRLAAEAGLPNHQKKDSTGICFIGERKFKAFLNEYLPAQPGAIKTLEGETIGQHDGLMFYTLGQRQGLKIGGLRNSDESPWYVVSKDLSNNTLLVAQGNNHPALFTQSLLSAQVHWIHRPPSPTPFRASAKTRYRQSDQACLIEALDNNQYRVSFDEPQRSVTPGQSVVFYQDSLCLGGGVIVG